MASRKAPAIDADGASARRGDPRNDNSLRGQAMQRARQAQVPRTLTPYEWEQWYAEHGVPAAHREPVMKPTRTRWRWVRRLLSRAGGS